MIDLSKISQKAGIYLLRCLVNDKIYIGKAQNLYQRIIRHKNSENYSDTKNTTSIIRAIQKYTWINFEMEILHEFKEIPPALTLLALECAFIEYYQSTDRQVGYNLLKVSSDWTGYSHSIQTKQKLSQIRKQAYKSGFINPRKGKRNSLVSIQKRLLTIKQNQSYVGQNNPRFDKATYTFQNMKTQEVFSGTRYEFYSKYKLSSGQASNLVNQKVKSVHRWKLCSAWG